MPNSLGFPDRARQSGHDLPRITVRDGRLEYDDDPDPYNPDGYTDARGYADYPQPGDWIVRVINRLFWGVR